MQDHGRWMDVGEAARRALRHLVTRAKPRATAIKNDAPDVGLVSAASARNPPTGIEQDLAGYGAKSA